MPDFAMDMVCVPHTSIRWMQPTFISRMRSSSAAVRGSQLLKSKRFKRVLHFPDGDEAGFGLPGGQDFDGKAGVSDDIISHLRGGREIQTHTPAHAKAFADSVFAVNFNDFQRHCKAHL